MKLSPYLHFSGQCEEAFNLYAKVFGAKPASIHRFAQSPMAGQFGADWDNKVMHVSMPIDGVLLLGSDAPGPHFQRPQGFAVCIEAANEGEAERIYKGLSESGEIKMPLQETFWAKRYGHFIDRFGTPWMINVSKPI